MKLGGGDKNFLASREGRGARIFWQAGGGEEIFGTRRLRCFNITQ